MALNNDQVIQHILNNPQLDEGQKLELLNNLPPPTSGNPLPKGTGSFLSTEDIKPTQQATSQQEEASGVGGSFLRGILKAPGQLIAPGLQASESILQKLGIIDPPAPGEQTEAEEPCVDKPNGFHGPDCTSPGAPTHEKKSTRPQGLLMVCLRRQGRLAWRSK